MTKLLSGITIPPYTQTPETKSAVADILQARMNLINAEMRLYHMVRKPLRCPSHASRIGSLWFGNQWYSTPLYQAPIGPYYTSYEMSQNGWNVRDALMQYGGVVYIERTGERTTKYEMK